MRELRNPFRLRASEHIESDETFVRLFSPEVLDMLSNPDVWERPQIIRSAPGGGKTSLLRLFTPSSLRTIHAHRTREYTKDLFRRLVSLGAMDENGPIIVGVFLGCGHSFATLEDLDIDDGRKRRLFLSLLNARIILATLRGILDLRKKDASHLPFISLERSSTAPETPSSLKEFTGTALFDWAQGLERTICEALDSFLPLSEKQLPGHDSLIALNMLGTSKVFFDGTSVAQRILIMLDDIHLLTPKQREWLLSVVITQRSSVSIWLAERMEALTVDELLSPGSPQGRDSDDPIDIEKYWSNSRMSKFEKMVSSIADRRTRDARDVEIGCFADCLQDTLDGDEWDATYRSGIKVVSARVNERAGRNSKFDAWICERGSTSGTPRELLIGWRTLEILIEREFNKTQQTLDFIEYDTSELAQKDSSDVRAAAELFVAREFNLPYYYGLSRLASLASSNIEQFLWLSGDIFEECVSAALLRKSTHLAPVAQERILRKSIKVVWKELPQRVRYGTQVMRLLESIGGLAQWETEKPTAPYSPGVTGVAISMSERDKLKAALLKGSDKQVILLGEVIASCIAHNLL
ncbi:MAG: hypothetical protein HGA87_06075, partial [Desulfobulbaceae bacterium]|nr:hypothetical protein [Desulfobulbaceae bacterium]